MKLSVTAALASITLIVCALLSTPAQAYPEPQLVSPSWQLDFEYQHPRPVAVRDAQGNARWYWYMSYKVTNNTSDERVFIPEITVAMDNGRIHQADTGIPQAVYSRVTRILRNPLLEHPVHIPGRLLQGEDYARESVAIWPHEAGINEMTIFVGGLSGEVVWVQDPLTEESQLLQRTLMIRYAMPGKPDSPADQAILIRDERDVMR